MDVVNAKNGVTYISSRKLGVPNAFFTKCGGTSEKYGLNLGFKPEDGLEVYGKNMKLAAEAAGFDETKLISWAQTHSNKILSIKASDGGLEYIKNAEFPDGCFADGYVTDVPGVVLGVKTADCVPVLLSAKRNGRMFAVGAVHAGWRGTAGGIVVNAVKALRHSCGDAEIYAAIGPCIGACCFEVDKDCVDEFDRLCGREIVGACFIKVQNGKYYGDLVKVNRMLLHSAGVDDAHIDAAGICTCCHPEQFFSHRYATKHHDGKRGTMLSVIWKSK